MAGRVLPKHETWVRFPSPVPSIWGVMEILPAFSMFLQTLYPLGAIFELRISRDFHYGFRGGPDTLGLHFSF